MNSEPGAHVQNSSDMNRSAPEPVPASFAAPTAAVRMSFHFGSGRQYSTSVKQTKCIIQRTQTQPALFGLRAQTLSRRLSA
jgi:hypothetical protein